MLKVLVAVDGSDNSVRAVRHVVQLIRRCRPVEVHLLNVQESVDAWEVRRFLRREEIRRTQLAHGAAQLKRAGDALDRVAVAYRSYVLVGNVPETIARFAKRQRCHQIIMGTRGMGAIRNLLVGSVATKVIHLSSVPVTLVK